MKTLILVVLTLALAPGAHVASAQTPAASDPGNMTRFSRAVKTRFDNIKRDIVEAADAMPESDEQIAGGHLLLFVTRADGWLLRPPYPARPLFGAIVATELLAALDARLRPGWYRRSPGAGALDSRPTTWPGWSCSRRAAGGRRGCSASDRGPAAERRDGHAAGRAGMNGKGRTRGGSSREADRRAGPACR